VRQLIAPGYVSQLRGTGTCGSTERSPRLPTTSGSHPGPNGTNRPDTTDVPPNGAGVGVPLPPASDPNRGFGEYACAPKTDTVPSDVLPIGPVFGCLPYCRLRSLADDSSSRATCGSRSGS
jgi:hypothetical protein